jgi:hypothetical protein
VRATLAAAAAVSSEEAAERWSMRGAVLDDDDDASAAAFGVALLVFFFALPCVLTALGLLMVAAEPMGRAPAPLPDDMARLDEGEGCE